MTTATCPPFDPAPGSYGSYYKNQYYEQKVKEYIKSHDTRISARTAWLYFNTPDLPWTQSTFNSRYYTIRLSLEPENGAETTPEFVRVSDRTASWTTSHGFRSDNPLDLKLYLDTLGDPSHINLPLYPYCGQKVPRSPWLNETVLNYAIRRGNLSVIKYLLTEWEHRDVIIKDRCICHPLSWQGITLPPLLLTILCHKPRNIEMTNDILELLTTHFKPDEIGMNWVCDIALRDQKEKYYGVIEEDQGMLLFVNQNHNTFRYGDYPIQYRFEYFGFYVGSLVAALVWRCREIWRECSKEIPQFVEAKHMQRMITILVKNGLDCNISGQCHKFKDLKDGTERGRRGNQSLSRAEDRKFANFFEETVRKAWDTHVMPIIEESCSRYQGLSEIFKYVLSEYLLSFQTLKF